MITTEQPTTIQQRISDKQELLLQQLKKTPIVQIACEKTGVGRATYYRWRKDDQEFSKMADEVLTEGSNLINDMAESQLLAAIRDQNMTAIIFWLKHHHPAYTTRVEILQTRKKEPLELNEKQQTLLEQALAAIEGLPTKTDEQK